jgi:hypothetical protein
VIGSTSLSADAIVTLLSLVLFST